MRRVLLFLLLLGGAMPAAQARVFWLSASDRIVFDPDGRGFQVSRCGNGTPYRSLCGKVGAAAALSSPTSVSAGGTISVSGNYQLSASGTGDITITAENVNLDLGQFTLTGRILQTSNANGLNIQNGFVNCNKTDNGADAGCIRMVLKAIGTAQNKVQYVKVRNAATQARGIRTEATAASTYSGPSPQVLFDHVDNLAPTDVSGTRWILTDVTKVQGGMEMVDSRLECAADTNACQGVMCFESPNCKVHNNLEICNDVTVAESCRANLADAQDATCTLGTADNMLVYDNDIDANDNRVMRVRCAAHARFFNNLVNNLLAGTGAIHLGDADNGEDQANMDFVSFNNTYTVKDGTVLMLRNTSGVSLINERVKCVTSCANGKFAYVRTAITPGTLSTATICNNPTVAGIGFTTENLVETGATLNYGNSGAASGTGTKNVIGCG